MLSNVMFKYSVQLPKKITWDSLAFQTVIKNRYNKLKMKHTMPKQQKKKQKNLNRISY